MGSEPESEPESEREVAPCGDCQSCQTPDGEVCYADLGKAICDQRKYTWCGPQPTLAPTEAPTPPGSGCVAIPGMNAGATDRSCSKCATGYKWWPCGSSPKLCECDFDQSPAPTPPTPPPAPTTAGCGSCTGCRFEGNGVCHTDIGKAYCDAFAGKAVWCGASLMKSRSKTQPAKAKKHKSFLRQTAGVAMIQHSAAWEGNEEL